MHTECIGVRLFHHCCGNSSQSYFWEATSRFNVNLHFSEYLVSISSPQWRYPCLLYDSIFEMPIMFVKSLQWQSIHSKCKLQKIILHTEPSQRKTNEVDNRKKPFLKLFCIFLTFLLFSKVLNKCLYMFKACQVWMLRGLTIEV